MPHVRRSYKIKRKNKTDLTRSGDGKREGVPKKKKRGEETV